MAKTIILGAVLLLMIVSVFSVIAYSYYYIDVDKSDNYDDVIIKPEPAKVAEKNTGLVKTSDCYEEVIQVKESGECLGVQQEKRLCYKHVITCSGMKTESIRCYDEVEQVKGNGECLGVPQEKSQCYKQVESCSGMKTISINCYSGIEQEKGYGECLNLPQEKSQCYKVKDYKSCA